MEQIENVENGRYTVLPIKDEASWNSYKKAQELFWVDEEVEKLLVKDAEDWKTLDSGIQHLIKYILAFFAISDGIVNENLTEEIVSRIAIREIKMWYDFQIMMEDIHNTVYSKLIDAYITDPVEKHRTFNAIENFPSIKNKINWVRRWLGNKNDLHKLQPESMKCLRELRRAPISEPMLELFEKMEVPQPDLARQILINAIMEGVFFSGSFCAIFWIYHHYHKLPGLSKANEYISRDEGMHTEFAIGLYRYKLQFKVPQVEVHKIMTEAVEIESEFINESLPKDLINMNSQLMTQYIRFVADQLLQSLGYSRLYNVTNPFKFMEKQSMSVRMTDFFMEDVTEYGIHNVGLKPADSELKFDEDF